MNEATINLLNECNAGCKTAQASMEQIISFIKNEGLKNLVQQFNRQHMAIGESCRQMLNDFHVDEKTPNPMTTAFSWVTTEMKLMVNDGSNKIAELLIDGCNMGIKSISQDLNKYMEATPESKTIAKKLVSTEQQLMSELLAYL